MVEGPTLLQCDGILTRLLVFAAAPFPHKVVFWGLELRHILLGNPIQPTADPPVREKLPLKGSVDSTGEPEPQVLN